MSLADQVNADIKQAMRDKNKTRLTALRALRGEIIKFDKSGSGRAIEDEDVTVLIKRLLKQRQDSIKMYDDAGRDELAQGERDESEVLQAYLPAALSEEELTALVDQAIVASGATGPKQMGLVMKELKGLIADSGKDADNRVVAGLVKDKLAAL